MAQNVTVAGTSFSDVPAVDLPKTGGGTATFMDTSDANATAGDIAQGKTAYVNGQKITGTGGGGGTTTIIVPEQTITVSSSYTQLQFDAPLVDGEEYKWTVNGTTNTGTAVSQYGSIVLLSITGCVFDYSAPNMYFDVNGSSYYGTYTVKVWQESGGGGGSTLITKTITQNGTYDAEDDDADGYSSVTVNVSGGGGGLVYETGTYTPASNTAQPTISFQNTHTTLPILVLMADATGSYSNATNTNHSFTFSNYYGLTGYPLNTSSSANLYAYAHSKYRASDASNLSNYNGNVTMAPDAPQSGTNYYSNWITTSGFKPGSNSTSRYWRSGRTYKWIAVWAPTT